MFGHYHPVRTMSITCFSWFRRCGVIFNSTFQVNVRFSTFRNPALKVVIVGIQYGLVRKYCWIWIRCKIRSEVLSTLFYMLRFQNASYVHGSDTLMDDDRTIPLFQRYVASQTTMQERADVVVLLTGYEVLLVRHS